MILFFFLKQMRHGRMPLVCILMHDFFENLDIWGKDDFFFFKMDEAWPHAPSLEMDAWFLEVLNFFFLNGDDDDPFLKMNKAWLNAPSSTINVNFEKYYCVGTFNKEKFE